MEDPVPPDDLRLEISDLVGRTASRIRAATNRGLAPKGVTWTQVRALRACVREGEDEPIRMSELAESLGIVRRSATSVVDELEVRGLVVRRGELADRRAVSVVVTPKGHRLLADVETIRRNTATELTAGLTPREQRSLRDLLAKIAGDQALDPDRIAAGG